MRDVVQRYGVALTGFIVAACTFWVLMMIVLPELMMIDASFRPNILPDEMGGPKDVYTLANYGTLWTNSIHLGIFLKTIWGSAIVTLLTLIVCYPIAYFLGQVAKGQEASTTLLLLVIPFWINEILRTFSWFIILSYQGPLNQLLLWLGVLDHPIRYLSGNTGVIAGMVYAYIM